MPRHSPCALSCFNFSPVYLYTLDPYFDCMSFANRFFLLNCSAPLFIRKNLPISLVRYLYIFTWVFSHSLGNYFFLNFRVLDLLFSYLIFNVHCLSAWWAQVDSNHRPCAYQAHALTTWAMSPFTLCLLYLYSWRFFFIYLSLLSPFGLVEMTGLEPVNPLLAKQVLSQLSYTPMVSFEVFFKKTLKIEQRINFFKSFFFSFKSYFTISLCRTFHTTFDLTLLH